MGVPAGTFDNYPPTQKSTVYNGLPKNTNSSSYTVNKGLDHSLKLNSLYHKYNNYSNYYKHNSCDCNYGGNYEQPSFLGGLGGLIQELLPVAIGVGAALILPKLFGGEGGIGGLFSRIFGGQGTTEQSTQPEENILTKMESQLAKLTAKNEELEKAITDMKAATKPVEGTKAPETQQPQITGTKPETKVVGGTPETTPVKHKVKLGETIFTIIEAEIKKQNPNVSRPELDALIAKTIEANKELLEANNKAKPIYNAPPRKLGDYIEKDQELTLILK